MEGQLLVLRGSFSVKLTPKSWLKRQDKIIGRANKVGSAHRCFDVNRGFQGQGWEERVAKILLYVFCQSRYLHLRLTHTSFAVMKETIYHTFHQCEMDSKSIDSLPSACSTPDNRLVSVSSGRVTIQKYSARQYHSGISVPIHQSLTNLYSSFWREDI